SGRSTSRSSARCTAGPCETARPVSMKEHAPATERNRSFILDVLREVLPTAGVVLEIASGTGQHAVYFAEHLPGIVWQPSDGDPTALASIDAWRADVAPPNERKAILLDVASDAWPTEPIAAVVCVNMIHIAPWSACEALLAGAGRLLPEGAPLILYGPYRIEG